MEMEKEENTSSTKEKKKNEGPGKITREFLPLVHRF